MSEISKYDAQKKKLADLCEEHDLTFRLRHNQYPITLTVRPLSGMDEQLSMLEEADTKDYISPDAYMVIYRKDGELATKINGTFTISEALRSKLKNIYVKLSDFWLQYFFRETMERKILVKQQIPVIDETETEDDENEDLPDVDDGEIEAEGDARDGADGEPEDPEAGENAADDDLLSAATQLVRMENKASISLLQRRLKIGYGKATQVMQALEDNGVVGPYKGSEPREVLPTDQPED